MSERQLRRSTAADAPGARKALDDCHAFLDHLDTEIALRRAEVLLAGLPAKLEPGQFYAQLDNGSLAVMEVRPSTRPSVEAVRAIMHGAGLRDGHAFNQIGWPWPALRVSDWGQGGTHVEVMSTCCCQLIDGWLRPWETADDARALAASILDILSKPCPHGPPP